MPRPRPFPDPGAKTRRTFLDKENDRYIVTSLSAQSHPGRALYESFYRASGDAGNCVKELKCDLFAERSSSNLFDANTVRLNLSSFAHVPYNRLRQALAATPLSRASPTTLRLPSLKIGARVRISARRIHVAMSGSCPDKTSFAAASPTATGCTCLVQDAHIAGKMLWTLTRM